MANTSMKFAFERMWQHILSEINNKADIEHTHDDVYVKTSQTLTVTGIDENGETYTWTLYGVEQ